MLSDNRIFKYENSFLTFSRTCRIPSLSDPDMEDFQSTGISTKKDYYKAS